MQNLYRHFLLIGIVIALSVWAIIPPETKLRQAKDLRGGATLVYQVEVGSGDAQNTLTTVAGLIKERLDPKGTLEISVVPIGESRIEITMPLPSEDLQRKRRAFEEELNKLEAFASIGSRLRQVLREPHGTQRDADVAALKAIAGSQGALIDKAIQAADRVASMQPSYEQAEQLVDGLNSQLGPTPTPEQIKGVQDARASLRAMAKDLAKAQFELESTIQSINARAVTKDRLRPVLELSNKKRLGTNEQTGKREEIASPRARAIDALKAQFPEAKDVIDRLTAQWDDYQASRSTLDDPADIKRMLRSSGQLSFRIAPNVREVLDADRLCKELRENGPKGVRSADMRWFRIDKLDGWTRSNASVREAEQSPRTYFARAYGMLAERGPDGEVYVVLWDAPGKRLTAADGTWGLAGATPGQDEIGRPAITFTMDALGAIELRKLTGRNIGQLMAVLLDDAVYTAPSINSEIGKNCIIQGEFSQSEINYVVRVLNAGSMAAKLSPEPISESTVGPELGKDNLERGLKSGIVSFVIICGFMIVYYFSGGVIATIALTINLLLLLALMAFNDAVFSLPGIAGVILAFGMAVDANVLIYERLREELEKGEPLRTAIRVAYDRAKAPILDGNITHLITCVVLGFFGTPEIRGFAITMSIGVITTLFCQLYITRVLYFWLVDRLKLKTVSMLPMAIPAIQRAMHTRIDWMRLCPIFFLVSGVLVVGSVVAVFSRGNEILDTVFRGGTRVTIVLKDQQGGKKTLFSRADVEERVKEIARKSQNIDERQLADAQILVINPEPDGKSNRFIIQTTVYEQRIVTSAITAAFRNELEINEPLTFTSSTERDSDRAPIYPIVVSNLGDNIRRDGVEIDVTEYMGGAVIVLDDLQPVKPTLSSLNDRLRKMQEDPQFGETRVRKHEIRRIKGTDQAVESAVILVKDENLNFLKETDRRRWQSELRPMEWRLASEAMKQSATLAGVESFSPAIATTFMNQAITAVVLSTFAIIVFVWARFLSLRYSLAAIIATLHDCIVTLGAIAVAEIIFNRFRGVSEAIGLLPFKIDLNVIAAVLTILGYSLNDKIVIMDRIRENRGKLKYATRSLINDSINQTLSRTIMTSSTVFFSSIVLYIMGGEALRGFAYCFIIGVIVGTYSSVAVAAPIVWSRRLDPTVGGVPPASEGTLATT